MAERVLIVYARAAYTRPVAEALAHELGRGGFVVECADVEMRAVPPPRDYAVVVVGTARPLGRHPRALVEYLAHHRDALADVPTFLFEVGRGSVDVGQLRRETGWLPAHAFPIVRPPWHVRWFGDPNAAREPRVHALAFAISDDVPRTNDAAPRDMTTAIEPTDTDVRRAITKAFGRHAVAEARHLIVDVEDDEVLLAGTVDSCHEHDAAIAAARRVPGIVNVIDHLVIEPPT